MNKLIKEVVAIIILYYTDHWYVILRSYMAACKQPGPYSLHQISVECINAKANWYIWFGFALLYRECFCLPVTIHVSYIAVTA